MSTEHFTIRENHGRHIAHCHCHHPIGAWTRAELIEKIRSL